MKTNPRKTIQKIWLGAAVMFALLLVIGTPRTALGQWNTSGNDISNANSGNVGVGLTVPLYKFDVLSGTNIIARFNSTAAAHNQVLFNAPSGYNSNLTLQNGGVSKWFLGNQAANNRFSFVESTGAVEVFSILQNGNVGIGTTAPEADLSFQPADYTSGVEGIKFQSSDNATHSIIQPVKLAAGGINVIIGANAYVDTAGVNSRFNGSAATAMINVRATDGFIRFLTNTSTGNPVERMQVNSSGNVGIGTTTPGTLQGGLSSLFGTILQVQNSSNHAQLVLSASGAGKVPDIKMEVSDATSTKRLFEQLYDGASNVYKFRFSNESTSAITQDNVLALKNDGNVGIGTAAPNSRLEVKAANAFSGTSVAASGTNLGNLVILTTDTQAQNVGGMLSLGGNRGANGAGVFGGVKGAKENSTDSSNDGYLGFYTLQGGISFAERMRISSIGNVGIGITAPAYKLDVNGTIKATALIVNGATITGSASDLSTGTLPDGRFPATLPAASGVNLTSLNASSLASGTLPDARFPASLPAASGVNLTSLNASSLASGTLPDARFPATLPAASGVNLTSLSASSLASGTLPDARFPATLPAASGTYLTALNASSLASGTVATARLGSGTANTTTFLRGDNTWAVPSGASQWSNGGSNAISYSIGNVGIGISAPTEKLHVAGNGKVTGNLTVDGNIAAKYQDVAEWVASSEQLPAATVVVLDSTKSNQVISSTQAYDTRVAGVISEQPGITLGESGAGKVLVSTTGRVLVQVDASKSPIHIGDLLVTSDVPGVAMKSEPVKVGGVQLHRPGTLIGKALEPLEKGKGKILVLLSLQ